MLEAVAQDGGAISGSFVQALLRSEWSRTWTVRDLNIVVPKGRGAAVGALVEGQGYQQHEGTIIDHMVDTCESHSIFKHKNNAAEAGPPKTQVTVTESQTDEVLAVILDSGNTATMNALTEKMLYSFYPKLTLRNVALMGNRWGRRCSTRMYRFDTQGLAAFPCTKAFIRECGYETCPAIARRVSGLRSIGVLTWNGAGVEEQDLTEASLAWSVNRVCLNVWCRNFGRRAFDN